MHVKTEDDNWTQLLVHTYLYNREIVKGDTGQERCETEDTDRWIDHDDS